VKPALGRNLGTLLGGPVAKPVPESPSAQPQLPLAQPGPGVRSLLRGQKPESAPENAFQAGPEQSPAQNLPVAPREIIPNWYFFAVDVLLVLVAVIFAHQCEPGTKWGLRLFSMALVILGCGMGVIGVVMSEKTKP
jgi:hypothetical protein